MSVFNYLLALSPIAHLFFSAPHGSAKNAMRDLVRGDPPAGRRKNKSPARNGNINPKQNITNFADRQDLL